MLFFYEGNHGVFFYMLYELNPNSSTPIMNETTETYPPQRGKNTTKANSE